MLKLRIALCLALVVGTLTLTNGIIYGARTVTIIYRTVISVVIFGFAGYALGVVAERFLKKLVEEDNIQEPNTNVVSEEQAMDELPTESAFSPFTSNNFEQISRPKE